LQIVISWFLSPLAAALIAFIIFVAVRTVVLRRAMSTDIAFYVLPVLILITIRVVRDPPQPCRQWLSACCLPPSALRLSPSCSACSSAEFSLGLGAWVASW
jgi:phosphate/sulfate permease